MAIAASISSPTIYNPSLSGLTNATRDIINSTARLSTGNRLVNAGDDVAALSISTQLQTRVTVLRQAQENTTQGNSFLQVAYGGLLTIRDVLDEMAALATQANSGSLTTSDRALLQQEFSSLYDEIDRLANTTSFAGINLLDGTVSGENRQTTTTTQATQATGSFTFTGNPSDGDTVILNGVTFTARNTPTLTNEFEIGGSAAATASNFATVLGNSTDFAISQASYSVGSETITITQDSGGALGNLYTIDQANSTASFTTNGASTQVSDFYTLQSGADDGLGTNSVLGSGTIGDALVNTFSQTASTATLTLTGAVSDGETLRIDDGNGSFVDFTFRTSATLSSEIQIGSTQAETIENAISTLNQYSSTSNFGLNQLEFRQDGDSLIITSRNVGDTFDFSGSALDVAETITNGSLTTGTLDSGTNTGVNTSGVNNSSFVGTISGFSATYTGADALTASLTVGSSTYSATISDTTPSSDTFVRFTSTSGGYFDVEIASGGLTVTNQDDADTFASRLDAAFAGLTFTQNRQISNFSGVNNLVAGSAEIRLDSFSDVVIEDISVTAPSVSGQDATIDITINGEIFRATSGVGDSLGAYETITLVNLSNGNETLRITSGASTNDFSDATAAATFETTLRSSFGFGTGGVGLDFQVGNDATDVINVSISDSRTTQLFSDGEPDISTQSGAASASTAITTALSRVNETLATIGSLQTRFDTAYDNLENTRLYTEEARSSLADTNIAEESTAFALAQLRAQSATAVIAQTQSLQSGLLDLLAVG